MKMLSLWECRGLRAYFLIWSKKRKICLELMMMECMISVIKEIWLKKQPFHLMREREKARGDWFEEEIRSVTAVIKLITQNIQYLLLQRNIIYRLKILICRVAEKLTGYQNISYMYAIGQLKKNSQHWFSQCCCWRAAQTSRAMFW